MTLNYCENNKGLRSRSAGTGHFAWSRSWNSNKKWQGAGAQFKIYDRSRSYGHL